MPSWRFGRARAFGRCDRVLACRSGRLARLSLRLRLSGLGPKVAVITAGRGSLGALSLGSAASAGRASQKAVLPTASLRNQDTTRGCHTPRMIPKVVVKAGHVRPLWAGHPWVFAQAVERVEGGARPGDEVLVADARGNVLGRGLYSPASAIAVRIFSRNPDEALNGAALGERIRSAVARRRSFGLPSDGTNAYRLVHADGDDLPGLIVDRYDDVLAVQIGALGIKQRQGLVVEALVHELRPRAIIDRSSREVAKREGFAEPDGPLFGSAEVTELRFLERGFQFSIPLELAQKTGYYLDQRAHRARMEELSRGRRVLDCFSYVGAVSLAAARGGATEVLAVDSSALAIEVGAECARQNGLLGKIAFQRGDALEALEHAGRHGGYDLVVCDPPKLAPTRASQKRAMDSMRRLAAAGARATRRGGLLCISSCSAALGLDELTRAVALGAREVNTRAVVLERLFQGPDHPVSAAFPEGLYLSSLLCEVLPL
jgi:23S rRNA (cytosine1962-C5)-methyltransferase